MPPWGAERSLRSKASPSMVWGSGRSVDRLVELVELAELVELEADPSAALRDDDKGDEGSKGLEVEEAALVAFASVAQPDPTLSDGAGKDGPPGFVVGCVGWRPAKRSNWWPERKRSCIQRKM